MPMIREYMNTQRIDAAPLSQAAYRIGKTAAATGNNIRQGFDQFGRGVDQVEDAVATNEQSDLSAQFAQTDLALTQQYEQAKQTGDPTNPQFAQDFVEKNVQPALDKMGDDLLTPQAKKMYQQASQKLTAEYMKRGMSDQIAATGQKAVDNFTSLAQSYANTVTTDPTTTQHAADMIDLLSPNLPQEHRDKLVALAKDEVFGAGAKAYVDAVAKNPNATADMVEHVRQQLDDPKNGFVDHVEPGTFEALHKTLDGVKDTLGAVQSQIAEQTFPDLIKRVADTGVDQGGSAQKLIDSYQGKNAGETQVWRAAHARDLQTALAYGQASSGIRTMAQPDAIQSINDVTSKIATASPDELRPLQAKQQAMVQALQQRDKAFSQAPADYVLQSSDAVQQRYAAYAQAPTPQNFAAYAQTSMAEQSRLYPQAMPRLVTQDMESHIGQSLAQVNQSPEAASQVGQMLSQYAQVMGPKYWAQASQELFHDKVLNKDQYVAASMWSKPSATGLAQDLLRASTMSPEDLAKTGGVTSMQADKASRAALAPLAATLGDATDGGQLLRAYEGALSKLIQVKGDTSAAAGIAQKMLLDEYQFSGTLRMPTNVDLSAVVAGTKSVQGDLGNHKIVIPPSFSGTGPVDQRAEYIQHIQDYGHWATSQKGDTALLYDEQHTPVYETIGGQRKQVELKWGDLEKLGKKNSWSANITAGSPNDVANIDASEQ